MKSLLQELQSRISKRRSLISDAESLVQRHYARKRIDGYDMLTTFSLEQAREIIREAVHSQKIDKKIFTRLLVYGNFQC